MSIELHSLIKKVFVAQEVKKKSKEVLIMILLELKEAFNSSWWKYYISNTKIKDSQTLSLHYPVRIRIINKKVSCSQFFLIE